MLRPRRNNQGEVEAINVDNTYYNNNNNNNNNNINQTQYSFDSPSYHHYKKNDTKNGYNNDKMYSLSPLDKWKQHKVFNTQFDNKTKFKNIFNKFYFKYIKSIKTRILNKLNLSNGATHAKDFSFATKIVRIILILAVGLYIFYKMFSLIFWILGGFWSLLFGVTSSNSIVIDGNTFYNFKDSDPNGYRKMMKSMHKSMHLYNKDRKLEFDHLYQDIQHRYCVKQLNKVKWEDPLCLGLFELNLKELYVKVIKHELHWNNSHNLIGDTSGHIFDIKEHFLASKNTSKSIIKSKLQTKSSLIKCPLLDGINELGKINKHHKHSQDKTKQKQIEDLKKKHKNKSLISLTELATFMKKHFGVGGECHSSTIQYSDFIVSKAFLSLYIVLKNEKSNSKRYFFDKEGQVFGADDTNVKIDERKYFFCQPLEALLKTDKLAKDLTMRDVKKVCRKEFQTELDVPDDY